MPTPSIPPAVEQSCYTVDELARVLNVSVRHIWRLRDRGKLPAAIRLGKAVRWPKTLIDGWLAAGCPTPPRR